MRKYLLVLFALLATSAALGQTVSTCTTSQAIALQPQKYQPVYAITLTSGDTCNLTFQPVLDPNASQSITLRLIQSSTAPYTGSISGGTWPSGAPSIPQTAGAQIFARCYVDTAGAFCFPIAPLLSPQVTALTSGSGTYTTPPGTVFLTVEMVGGGGGGSGSGPWVSGNAASGLPIGPWVSTTNYPLNSTVTYNGQYYMSCTANINAEPGTGSIYWSAGFVVGGDGVNGTASTFGSLVVSGGSAGTFLSNEAGSGGTASGGDLNQSGTAGANPAAIWFGGWPIGPGNGGAGTFAGSGGSGGTVNGIGTATCPEGATNPTGYSLFATQGGNGGGAGGYLKKTIMAPSPSYSYSVGQGGAGGAAGFTGAAAQPGSAGIITVSAYQ